MVHSNAVEFRNVSMQFPGVLANDNVSFSVRHGEVFALVGENGAGKSTAMNILYGILEPTAGEVYVNGKRVQTFQPEAAISRGVGMVHQHFKLVPSFTVTENIVLCREPRRFGLLYHRSAAVAEVERLAQEYGLAVDPNARVQDLSVGLQQRVEILKTLYRGARILILDEPTAVLTPQETDELFKVIRRIVRERNMTVLLITHKLYEVKAISDRVGVMRQGRLLGIHETKDVSEQDLASMMVGREVLFDEPQRSGTLGDVLLEVEDLHVSDNRALPKVRGVSFSVRSGEILGIAAIEGNGQSELLEAVTGMRPKDSGRIRLMGKLAENSSPRAIRRMGLSHIPEDRLATGLSKDSSVSDNLLAGKHREREFAALGLHLKRSSIERYAAKLYASFDIRGAGVDTPAGSMSGGNMQKAVLAREFAFDTPILVIAQPTRGVDVGAMEFIHQRILEKRNHGCAILLSSADLDEVLRLSDRIVTLYEGRITGIFDARSASKAQLGLCMAGAQTEVRE